VADARKQPDAKQEQAAATEHVRKPTAQ
jgi:hypothetical protein